MRKREGPFFLDEFVDSSALRQSEMGGEGRENAERDQREGGSLVRTRFRDGLSRKQLSMMRQSLPRATQHKS